ncbi:restriction endonuclease subunit S [Nostoc sp. C110]|uniref:restriction endonuclease subunit S n=1 Tax=Nostoc sp. C110 TaxID=3349876 RepID=UPI00370DA9B7
MSAVFPWKVVPLQNIAEQIDYGLTASATDSANGPKFLRITDIQEDRVDWSTVPFCNCTVEDSKKYALMEGDIVFARTGATTGKSFLVRSCPLGSVFASYLIRVRPSTKVVPGYLARFFQTPNYWNQITRSSTGTAQAGVNASNLKKLAVPLPPLEEQHRIAEILDRAEELRSKRREAIAQLDTLTQSIFLEMFGDPVRNPKGWVKMPFGEVCVTRLGKMLDKQKQTGEYRRMYLRNANVQWFRFDLTDIFEMDFRASECKILRLQYGDLLICEGGEPGRAAIWRDQIPECYYQKTLHRARPKNDLANSEYLAYLLWLLSKSGGLSDHITSSTISHLTGEKLKVMNIPIPPIDLQKEFAHRVESVEKLKASHRASLSELDALFASLQNRAFRGEL